MRLVFLSQRSACLQHVPPASFVEGAQSCMSCTKEVMHMGITFQLHYAVILCFFGQQA